MNPTLPPAAAASKWVIYSTYDPKGAASRSAAEQVAAYREAGFDVLVVDTSASLLPARRADWAQHATAWFQRSNEGYDFKSYQAGLAHLTQSLGVDAQRLALILTNDSCFGPFLPLSPIVDAFDAHAPDQRVVFGMSDSHERRYHLQSYWLYFRANVTPLLAGFFAGLPDISDREEAIDLGELSISDFMVARGCRLFAHSSVADVVAHYGRFAFSPFALLELGARRLKQRPRYSHSGDGACWKYLLKRDSPCSYVNQMLDFAGPLFFERRIPFVKKRLLSENPNGEVSVQGFPALAGLGNAEVEALLRQSPLLKRRYPKSCRS